MILKGKFNTANIFTENVEEACVEQIKNLLNIEAFAGTKIRIMPDCHAGKEKNKGVIVLWIKRY